MSNVIVFLWISLIVIVLILCVWAMRRASDFHRCLFLFDAIVLMINIGVVGFAITYYITDTIFIIKRNVMVVI